MKEIDFDRFLFRLIKILFIFLMFVLLFKAVTAFSLSEQVSVCSVLNLSDSNCSSFWGNYSQSSTVYVQNVTYLNQTVYVQNSTCDLSLSIPYQRLQVDFDRCNYSQSLNHSIDLSNFYLKSEIDNKLMDFKSSVVSSSPVMVSKNNDFSKYFPYALGIIGIIIVYFYFVNKKKNDFIPQETASYPPHGNTQQKLQKGDESSFK